MCMTVLVTCTKCMTIWRQFSFKAQKTGSLYHRFNNNAVGIFICMTTWCYTLNNVVPQLRSVFKNPSYHNWLGATLWERGWAVVAEALKSGSGGAVDGGGCGGEENLEISR